MSAACTMACSSRPCVSTRTWRFLPLIFLPASYPCRSMQAPFFCALHALAIDDRCRRTSLSPGFLPALDVEGVVDAIEGAVRVPTREVVVHRAARGQVFRQGPVLAARAQQIHHRVHHLADVDRPLVAAGLGGRDPRGDERPLLVGQVAGIAQAAAVVAASVLDRPHLPRSRACPQLSQTTAAARWMAPRKWTARLS